MLQNGTTLLKWQGSFRRAVIDACGCGEILWCSKLEKYLIYRTTSFNYSRMLQSQLVWISLKLLVISTKLPHFAVLKCFQNETLVSQERWFSATMARRRTTRRRRASFRRRVAFRAHSTRTTTTTTRRRITMTTTTAITAAIRVAKRGTSTWRATPCRTRPSPPRSSLRTGRTRGGRRPIRTIPRLRLPILGKIFHCILLYKYYLIMLVSSLTNWDSI